MWGLIEMRCAVATTVTIVCAGGLALFPLVSGDFYLQLITKIMIMSIFAMSLDLLVGYTGLASLGHAAFFGVAGYALALLTPQNEPLSLWMILPTTMACAAITALLIGALALRTSGVYFIMATLALAQMLFFFVHDSKLAGGSDGIYIYFRPTTSLFGWNPFDLNNKLHFYYFVLILFSIVWLLLGRVVRSRFGHALIGIRINEQRMRSLGFPTYSYKLACFVLAGTFSGLAGFLAALQFGFVNPEQLSWHYSASVLMMVVLGGMGSLSGAVVGAFVMTLAQEWLLGLTKHWQLVMGIFFVTVALTMPRGLIGSFAQPARTRTDSERASHE